MRSLPDRWCRKCQGHEEMENIPSAKNSRDHKGPCDSAQVLWTRTCGTVGLDRKILRYKTSYNI